MSTHPPWLPPRAVVLPYTGGLYATCGLFGVVFAVCQFSCSATWSSYEVSAVLHQSTLLTLDPKAVSCIQHWWAGSTVSCPTLTLVGVCICVCVSTHDGAKVHKQHCTCMKLLILMPGGPSSRAVHSAHPHPSAARPRQAATQAPCAASLTKSVCSV